MDFSKICDLIYSTGNCEVKAKTQSCIVPCLYVPIVPCLYVPSLHEGLFLRPKLDCSVGKVVPLTARHP